MSETAMKFGPEWLRALSHGNSAPSPVSYDVPLTKYKLAQYRYGREEMLALFSKDLKIPEELAEFDFLVTDKCQLPLALLPVTEDEQRIWSRSVNSDVALRGSGKPVMGPGNGMARGGRGGSVDRGRGRGGRGGYYQRGVNFEESEDGPPGGFTRLRTLERSQSANEKDQRWDERDRKFERTFAGRSGILEDSSSNNSSNLSKQESSRLPSDNWRRNDKDEDGGWRTAGTRGDKFAGRSSWRGQAERDRIRLDFDGKDKTQPNRDVTQNGPGKNVTHHPRQRTNSGHFWDIDMPGDNLPEWSVDESTVGEGVGTFDSSGAFMEPKISDAVCNSDEIYSSDEDNDCAKKKDTVAKGPAWSVGNDDVSSEVPPSKHKLPEKNQSKAENEDSPDVKLLGMVKRDQEKSSRKKQSPETKTLQSPAKERTFEKPQNSPKKNHVDKAHNRTSSVQPTANARPENSIVADTQLKSIVPDLPVIADELPGPTEEDAFAHHKKATESMMDRWTEEEEQIDSKKSVEKTKVPPHHDSSQKWFYQDPQSEIQGPFSSAEMYDWFKAGYFSMDLLVRRACDERFLQLGELIQSWGRIPFSQNTSPPSQSAQAAPVQPSTVAAPVVSQPTVPTPATATQLNTPLIQPDTQMRLMHQQFFQQIVQQQLFYRQSHIEQLINYLKQQESFAKLSPQQQSQAVSQLLAQMQQMHGRPPVTTIPDQPVLDGVPPVPFPLMGLTIPSLLKGDLPMWNVPPPAAGNWPLNQSAPQPASTSIWDTDAPISMPIEVSELEKKMAAEEDEKRRQAMETMKKLEEERKQQEETERLFKKLQQRFEEDEKRKMEEMQHLKEEEQRRQDELRQLEERRKEDERRMEELRQQEELRKQEELRRQEELRLEEERKKAALEELRRLEKERKKAELEEQQRQQQEMKEELKKKEELKRIEELRRQQKKVELERLKEAERLKEQQAVEAKKQRELQRQELEKQELQRNEAEMQHKEVDYNSAEPKGPVWCMINNDWPSEDLSLATIQKLQEKKDKEEKERLRLQQIQQQKLIIQQQSMKQAQANKNGLSWAKRSAEPTNAVKSLTEIQQEEAQRLAQQQQQQIQQQKAQKMAAAAPVNEVTGVWGNSSQLNRVTSGTAWNSSSNAGFWDDPIKSVPVQKPTKNSDSAFPALINSAKPASVNSNKNKNVRAKKDEDAVLKIFEAHRKPTDEFTAWCTEALSSMPSSVDVPTFVAFLKDVESPFEVSDYVKSYLGEGKEAHEFGKQFLERRSKFRNQAKQSSMEENMWGPAPAITPLAKPTNNNDCDATTCTKGKTKKKRNKMQKLDSSMLGFTVQPNPDRINVGEIDRVEGM